MNALSILIIGLLIAMIIVSSYNSVVADNIKERIIYLLCVILASMSLVITILKQYFH